MEFLEPFQYQPRARALFEQLAAAIQEALPDARIEHVGSSSMPDLVSKGDLDIYVEVDPADFDACINALTSIGCRIKEGSERNDALCPFELDGYPLDVGVQLVARGSKYEFFLTFRDRINGDAAIRQRYNELKLNCSGLAPDEYRRIKADFIESVLGESD